MIDSKRKKHDPRKHTNLVSTQVGKVGDCEQFEVGKVGLPPLIVCYHILKVIRHSCYRSPVSFMIGFAGGRAGASPPSQPRTVHSRPPSPPKRSPWVILASGATALGSVKHSMQNVLIIGAGAAGLAAARDLATAGVPVTILEARERIGGRVYTYHDSTAAVPIELGAEFVHGKHPALMKILEESMIPFCDVSERHLYFDKGKLINSHEFWNELTALMDLLSLDKPDQTFKEFLASLPDNYVSHQASEVASLFVQGFHASRIDRIGTHGLVKANEAEDEIGGEKGFRVLSGYDRVVQALYDEAVAKGAEVKLRTVVKEIHWDSDVVEVVGLDDAGSQQRFRTARVLITLPLGVLQADSDQPGAVRFVPQLPEEKRDAIQTLVMGHALRITLLFRERFWERLEKREPMSGEEWSQFGFIHNPEASLPTWWTQLHIRAPVLVGADFP